MTCPPKKLLFKRCHSDESTTEKRRGVRWLLEAVVFVAAFAAVTGLQTHTLLDTDAAAPTLVLKDLKGTVYDLRAYRGKKVILHFWATWCGVCQREFGALQRLASAPPDNTVVLSVLADAPETPSQRATLKQFLNEHSIDYPVLLGGDDEIRRFKVNAFPTNYYIAPDGRIGDRTVGMSTGWIMKLRAGLL